MVRLGSAAGALVTLGLAGLLAYVIYASASNFSGSPQSENKQQQQTRAPRRFPTPWATAIPSAGLEFFLSMPTRPPAQTTEEPDGENSEREEGLGSVLSSLPSSAATPTQQPELPYRVKVQQNGTLELRVNEKALPGNHRLMSLTLNDKDNLRHYLEIVLEKDGREVYRSGTSVFPGSGISFFTQELPRGSYMLTITRRDSPLGNETGSAAKAEWTEMHGEESPAEKPPLRLLLSGQPERDIAYILTGKEGGVSVEVRYGKQSY